MGKMLALIWITIVLISGLVDRWYVFGGFEMTALEEKLVEVGNVLARSIGHKMDPRCPKISPAVPCVCGAGAQQAKALSDWDEVSQKVKMS